MSKVFETLCRGGFVRRGSKTFLSPTNERRESDELCDLSARLHRLRDARRDLGMCRFELSKLGPKQHEQPHRRGARNGRGAMTLSENCDLTKEIAGNKFRQRLAFGRDCCSSLDEDKEGVAGRAFTDKPDSLIRVLHMEPIRKLHKLIFVQRAEELDAREIVDAGYDLDPIRVAASGRALSPLCHRDMQS